MGAERLGELLAEEVGETTMTSVRPRRCNEVAQTARTESPTSSAPASTATAVATPATTARLVRQ